MVCFYDHTLNRSQNQMCSREFHNSFSLFSASSSVLENGKLKDVIKKQIEVSTIRLLKILEENLVESKHEQTDNSVYTGTAGHALLYFHLDRILSENFLNTARHYCDLSTKRLSGRRVTFLCGDAGSMAIAAVVYNKLGEDKKSKDIISRLEALHLDVVPLATELPDEVLYGRAGYLYALLFVQKHLGKSSIHQDIIQKVIESIFISGKQLSKKEKLPNCPLFYKWHGKPYIGAAHGIVGILYVLLLAKDYLCQNELNDLILPTINFIVSLKFKSGNFPSSLGNSDDKLIHWCHGAPGVIHLLTKAYEVYEDEKFLSASRECANVIWQRGLLKKGYGICHGVSGNAYAFLTMYQITKEEDFLYKAIKFAEWCFEYGTHGCRIADRPFSLFEGLAGTIYFLVDILNPDDSRFPAFSL